ncbi:MAG TPA: cysteine desulfurase family protein, partial [Candidatus Aminicenantes bacterium]|nr:cysteine desulfurase family protein [Candidatus Aminicenantes bacterium]
EHMEKQGFEVTYLDVHEDGLVRLEELAAAIRPDTALVSIMYANNEIGTIQPVEDIVRIGHEKGILVHTDAVQTLGKIDIHVDKLGVDLLSLSGHKIYGPKGVGALFVRKGVNIHPFIHGGHQERGMRAGTENTSGIIGFGEAVRVLSERAKKDKSQLEKLAERLKKGIEDRIPKIRFNGHPEKRIKSTLNFAFPGLESEAILLALATKEIYVSTGSACSEDSEEASHVLMAIGLRPEIARSCIRMSLGRFNTDDDIDAVLRELPGIIDKLRKISAFDPD